MIDPQTEDLIAFQQAGKRIPGNPALCTLHRWRLSGVRGTKLETLLVCGIRYTSVEAISRFIREQNRDQQPAPAITSKQRRVQAETANKLLEAAGI
ncbi:MAG: DUF1580 domain-containing protein [Planctomycetaceae bacterium]